MADDNEPVETEPAADPPPPPPPNPALDPGMAEDRAYRNRPPDPGSRFDKSADEGSADVVSDD